MEIVIEIADDDYYDVLQYVEGKANTEFENLMISAIKDGTQLQRGRWINLEKTKCKGQVLPFWGRYECSNCGGYGQNDFKYCPNCGAKMVEPIGKRGRG